MTDKPDNPQAFPHGNPTDGGDIGMTLRDYAVIHYTAALIASEDFAKEVQATCNSPGERVSRLIGTAGKLADATLKERVK